MPLSAETRYDMRQVTDVAVSPDGDRVAILTREYDPDADEPVDSLWVVPADGSRNPHRLTRADDASRPIWSPDGEFLGFVAARDRDVDLRTGRDDERDKESDEDEEATGDNGEDEPKPQVWAFDMRRGGDARQITDREDGISAFDWGPESERIVVAARDPTDDQREQVDQREEGGPIEVERLQHKVDGQGYLDEVTTYLFVVDVETRTSERIEDANDGGYSSFGGMDPAWGPEGRIAYLANYTDRPDDNYVRDLYTIAPDGSDRRQVTESDLTAANPAWSPDGQRLAFEARPPDNWYVPREVYVDNGEGTPRSLSADLDRTLAYGSQPQWVNNDRLVALIGDEGRDRIVQFHIDGGPERVFTSQTDHETLATMDVGGSTVAMQTATPTGRALSALDVESLDSDPDSRTELAAFDDWRESVSDPTLRRIHFEGARGDEVEALVFAPGDTDPGDSQRGVLLDIHGGPMAHDGPATQFKDCYFLSRGYLICKVNYHGSTSYGREFCESLRGEWGTHEVTDLLAAADELVERGWADPERLFPTGFSQGGVNTGYLVTESDRWAAAAAEHGIYDLRSSFGTDDSHNWLEADFGLPWENPEGYGTASSITNVEEIETPLLVTAGEEDWRCPPSQAEQLYVSVRKRGVDAKLVIYQDEHHNVGDPDRAIHRLETLDEWFATYDPGRELPE